MQRSLKFWTSGSAVTPKDISETMKVAPLGNAVSAFNAVVFSIWMIGDIDSQLLLGWLVFSLLTFGILGQRAWAIRDVKLKRVSNRTFRRAVSFTVLGGLPWVAMVLLAFTSTLERAEIMVMVICAGMSAGGCFMLHRIPLAAAAYSVPMLVCFAITVGFAYDDGAGLAIMFYTFAFATFIQILALNMAASSRERDRTLEQLADANAKLEKMHNHAEWEAHHDPLTDLGNRRGLEREAARRIDALNNADRPSGVVMLHIDLDRFKEINDTLGHAAGDQVLGHVADVLKEEARETDYIARVGGDEFVILSEADGDRARIECLASRIINELSKPISYKGDTCSFGASIGVDIGVASETSPGIDPARMLSNADIALYRAKNTGRGRFEFYHQEMRADIEAQKSLSDELLLAVKNDEFEPFFQPQVDAHTGRIVAVEALARWRHPTRGLLVPAIFLPTAERLGMTAEIDRAILRKAHAILRQWRADGAEIERVSVNVSAHRLQQPGLIRDVEALGVKPGEITFEVLESVVIDSIDDEMRHTLDRLDEMGIRVEIDDFGTGHASLVGVVAVRPSKLKIARELVSPVVSSQLHVNLVRSIVGIAKSLDLQITAEGVETEDMAKILAELGCDYLQGYHFGRPMPADEMRAGLPFSEPETGLAKAG